MLRALVAATSMLKTVESGIRRRPIIVPSVSATAITILVRDPSGRRIAARVSFASASALLRMVDTSAADNPPVAGTNHVPPVIVPVPTPAGGLVLSIAGKTTPPRNTLPGGGKCKRKSPNPAEVAPLNAVYSATSG